MLGLPSIRSINTATRGMGLSVSVAGLHKVINNLMREKKQIGDRWEIAVKRVGVFLLRESKKIVPVQTGNLKGGGYTRKISGEGKSTVVAVGYVAPYAPYVHEIPSPWVTHGQEFNIKHADDFIRAKGTWWGTVEGGMFPRGENQQWKFLEQPMNDKRGEMLHIVYETVKLRR